LGQDFDRSAVDEGFVQLYGCVDQARNTVDMRPGVLTKDARSDVQRIIDPGLRDGFRVDLQSSC
jgi:hypothetical protein